ncbi:MAG: magnesium transporter [bacterium]|nr:magnesium transporter [bacterium]
MTTTGDINYWGHLVEPEIKELLNAKDYKGLREALADLESPDIAEALLVLSPEERAVVFRILPRKVAAEVFAYLPIADEEELLHNLGNEHVTGILNEMEPDDRTALLEELPGQVTKRLIASLSPQERKIAQQLLGYPEYSIGRLMTPEYVSIQEEWSVQETMTILRKTGRDKETLNTLYVTDSNDRLTADVSLKSLIFAEPESRIDEIMNTHVAALRATDDQEMASEMMLHYDLYVLPVVDSEGTLVGIVTADDVLDVVVEETTEDMQLMAGMEALEEPYSETPFVTMARKRGGWLFVLFLGEMITVSVMHQFESAMSNASIALLFFLPLIISCGGNSGSQASTLVIRALSVQDVSLRDWFGVLWREMMTGLMLGVFLGMVALLRVVFWPHAAAQYGDDYFFLGVTVGCSVIGIVLMGTITGSMLPFILRTLGIDPAMASGPLVATLMDTLGVTIFFSMAMFFLM